MNFKIVLLIVVTLSSDVAFASPSFFSHSFAVGANVATWEIEAYLLRNQLIVIRNIVQRGDFTICPPEFFYDMDMEYGRFHNLSEYKFVVFGLMRSDIDNMLRNPASYNVAIFYKDHEALTHYRMYGRAYRPGRRRDFFIRTKDRIISLFR